MHRCLTQNEALEAMRQTAASALTSGQPTVDYTLEDRLLATA